MSPLERIWQRWIQMTFLLTVGVGVMAAGFVAYRGAVGVRETRVILLQLLSSHLEREAPRIADEVYLRLETLTDRERMLNDLLGQYGTAQLSLDSDPAKDSSEAKSHQWLEEGGGALLQERLRFGDVPVGVLRVSVFWAPIWRQEIFQQLLWSTLAFLVCIFVVWVVISRSIQQRVFSPVLREFQDKQRRDLFIELATQVAHDIRSPLAALSFADAEIGRIPEESRVMIRGAIGRIQDIASQLIIRAKALQGEENRQVPTDVNQSELISVLIESVLAEKRLQYRSRIGVQIEALVDPRARMLFASVNAVEFKRAISNLINNAVEAMTGSGVIRIGLAVDGSTRVLRILVSDEGKGISTEVLHRILAEGGSHGKKGGLGLGLSHARKCAERWGGKLQISSIENQGTVVEVEIPVVSAPAWFAREVVLSVGSRIVIVDDDYSVHQAWERRIDLLRGSNTPIQTYHFATSAELRERIEDNVGFVETGASPVLFLVDYELGESRETGIDLIANLGIEDCSVLVTSRFEEQPVRDACRKLGLRILPKSLVGFVPLRVNSAEDVELVPRTGEPSPSPRDIEGIDAVLLDDDPLVRKLWEFSARKSGKRLLDYSNAEDLVRSLDSIPLNIPIYVDSDLKAQERGESLIVRLSEKGYTSLYLASGYVSAEVDESLAAVRGYQGCRDKSPPWERSP